MKANFISNLIYQHFTHYGTPYVCINKFFIFLDYEINGIENLPKDGPALLIYYHGAIPVDIYYFIVKVLFAKNRLVHTVADHFLFKVPGKMLYILYDL